MEEDSVKSYFRDEFAGDIEAVELMSKLYGLVTISDGYNEGSQVLLFARRHIAARVHGNYPVTRGLSSSSVLEWEHGQ